MLTVCIVGEQPNAEPPKHGQLKRETSLDFLLRCGAFKHGRCRRFLLDLGLRWDASLNLRPAGPWHRGVALRIAEAIRPELVSRFDRVVLLGQRVCDAFSVKSLLTYEEPFLALPHPSGRCRMWRDRWVIDAARELMIRHLGQGVFTT